MDSDFPLEQTPATRRRNKVREAILAAAERMFAKEGESGLSIRRLADEIDYSPSAIYKYFGSKEELLEELKDSFFERLLAQVDRGLANNPEFHDRARACVTTYIATATARPHHYVAAFCGVTSPEVSACRAAPEWEDFRQSAKGQAFSVLVDLVQDGQAEGVFDASIDPFMAANSMWASMHGLALLIINMPRFQAMQPERGITTEDFITYHADNIMRGFSARPWPSRPIGSPDKENGTRS
jgi:AcrR family transcriptional regulator